ncbi:MAG: 6-carboxytetrahydropterin synthase [Gemmatimonadales bacterium]
MPLAYLTRIVEFTAGHRFPDTPEFAGATRDHTHRYRCEVTVKGQFDPARGGVWGLNELKALLQREIVAPLDGKHINDHVAAFGDRGWVATGEAVAVYLWNRLAPGLPAGVTLHRIRVQESDRLFSEYYGEE